MLRTRILSSKTAAVCLLLCTVLFATSGSVSASTAIPGPDGITATNAVLMDVATGSILWGRQIDEPVVPASLTKLMTLKLALEAVDRGSISLSDLVPVSVRAWRTGGSRMFLSPESQVPLEEILKGIAVVSGNDACVAVAEFLGGTVENFVSMMNARAQEIGLTSTRFVDPHGISDDNQISARDIAILARMYVIDHPWALEFHSLDSYTHTPVGEQPITQHNRNRLISTYEGADGLKTGFTQAAGYNLVATAERAGTRFIGVVLGVRASSDYAGEHLRAQEMAQVLDHGFRNFTTLTLAARDEVITDVRVYKGQSNSLMLVAHDNARCTVQKGTESRVERVISIDEPVIAPISSGQVLGSITLMLDGEQIAAPVAIVAANDVGRGAFLKRLIDSIRLLFAR